MMKYLKKTLALITLLLTLTAVPAFSQDKFYAKQIDLEPGHSAVLEFILDNTETYYGFQADITLPENLEFVLDNGTPNVVLNRERMDDTYQLAVNMTGRILHVAGFSSVYPHSPIKGNSGKIFEIEVTSNLNYIGGYANVYDIKMVNAEDHDAKLSSTLTALNVLPTAITLQPSKFGLFKNTEGYDTQQIEVYYTPNSPFVVKTIKSWTSETVEALGSDEVATVENGLVKAVDNGVALITAESINGKTAQCEVTVTAPTTGLSLIPESITLEKGDSQPFKVLIYPPDATDVKIEWTSSDETVVQIGNIESIKGETALIKAVGAGESTITIRSGEFSATSEVKVVISATEVYVEPVSDLYVGHPIQLMATVYPVDATDKTLTWASSDETIATVDADGIVTPLSLGETYITVTCPTLTGSVSNSLLVKVVPTPAESIELNEESVKLKVGGSFVLEGTVLPEDTTDKTITWSSSNENIATVDAEGKITAVALGETVVTATCGEATATCAVEVIPTPAESIELSAENVKLKVGESFLLEGTVLPEDTADKTIIWSSSNEDIATVDAEGKITAVALGETVVTATCGEATATCAVEVIPIPAENIELSAENVKLKVGEIFLLEGTVLPEDTTDKTIVWSSSNEDIATVDAEGKITAVAVGETVITATCGEATATCAVEVVPTPAESILLNKDKAEIKVGENVSLTATVLPETTTDKTLTWSSQDERIATVDEEGNVTGGSIGQTVIKVSCGDAEAECLIDVVRTPVTEISIIPTEIVVISEQSATLKVNVFPTNATDSSVLWSSDDESIAIVNAEGKVTGVNPGVTTITATSVSDPDIHATCTVTVNPKIIPVTGISISEKELAMTQGDTHTLTATVTPEDATDKTVTWTSSNPEVASVDAQGVVTAVYKGQATITATSADGQSASCEVTVIIPATGITLDKSEMIMEKGTSTGLTATVEPVYTSDELIWSSANESIATVVNGVVTAIEAGETVITAKCGAYEATCHVTVIISANGVILDKENIYMMVGQTDKLTATVQPEDATDKTVIWKSSNESVATVDNNGNIVALSLGETIITATCGAASDGCKVIVIPTPATSVTLSVADAELKVGESVTLIPTVKPDDTTDKTVNWSSADDNVATVDEQGIVTAVSLGEVIITASCGDVNADCKITVVRTPVTGLSLTNSELRLKEGQTSDLGVIVVPAEATDPTVMWSSDDESVATVDSKGIVTAHTVGTTIITVTSVSDPAVKATCKVIVERTIVEVTGIAISDTSLTLTEEETYKLTATVTPVNATDQTITWESSNPNIATVSSEGLVTAVMAGTATIYASSSNGLTAQCAVTVIPKVVLPLSITLSNSELLKKEGESAELIAIVLPVDTTDPTLVWSSSNEEIATVIATENNKAMVNAVKQGMAIITATTVNGLQATCTVTVIPSIVAVEDITLNKNVLDMTVGDTEVLIATITPEDATDKTVTWKTSDPMVATVDSEGKVTAVSAGTATIYASSSNGKTAECVVTVQRGEVAVESISLTNTELIMHEGEVTDLTAIVLPNDATDKSLTWVSNDESIVTVRGEGDNKGIVSALKIGTAVITVSAGNGVQSFCTVNVIPIAVESITLDKTILEMTVGDTEKLTATVTPDNATDKTVTWRSSDRSIATVDSEGQVTAVSAGTATIYASSSNGKTAECQVTVERGEVAVESISLTNTELIMHEGEVTDLTAIVLPQDATDKSLTWESNDESIVTVRGEGDNKGIVSALKIGTAVITVSAGNGVQSFCTVNVIPIAVESITLDKTILEMTVGDTEKLTATVTPDNATDKTVTWRSSDRSIATVDSEGKVTAVSAGTATIYASSSNGKTAECQVTVERGEVAVESISLTNTELIMHEGEVTDLTAIVLPQDATDKSLTWVSNDESIVTVRGEGDNKGIVSALKIGTTVITVSAGNGVQSFCTVTVIPIPVESISLDKTILEMTVGDTEKLTATVTPDNATDKTVTWRSSDRSIATVDSEGKVTAVSAGTATIYASSSNGKTAECQVTVERGEVAVESISLTNTELTIHVGHTTDLTAIVHPDDATDKTLTWTCADEAIATVTPDGENRCIISGNRVGETIVTARAVNGVQAICKVTVVPEDIDIEVTLDKTSLEMTVGDTEKLTATITPDNAPDKTVTWRSSDPAIATVNQNGDVTAVSVGMATIYASSANGKTAECVVTVERGEVAVESISLTNTELTIREGYTTDLTAIVHPDDATDKTLTWTSDDETIATVTPDGDNRCIISGIKVGQTIVTARAVNGVQAICKITVIPNVIVVEDITLNKTSLNMIVGDKETLIATVTPADATDKTVTWRSSDPAIAMVNQNGDVTAVSVGVVTIYASSSNGKTAECEVTVERGEVAVESISLTNTELTIREGYTTDLTAIVHPEDATDKTLTWTSDDETIATVTPDGENRCIISGNKVGETIVTAKAVNGVQAICKVTVVPVVVEDITLDKDKLEMTVGDVETLIATVTPADATDKTVTWRSSDPAIATVNENGDVTAVSVGVVTIYASSSNGKTAECEVTVERGEVAVESISLTNTELTIREGYTTDLTAIVHPEDATDKTLTWTSDDEAIATVTPDGENRCIISGNKVGETIVTAKAVNGVQAICKVTVVPVVVEDITLDKDKLEMTVGDVETLIATVTPADATDKTVTWRSSDPAIASVNENGDVTAVSVGVVTIYASSSNGKTAECEVTVVAGEILPTGITLTNTELLMREGHTADITAIVYPSDATDKTVTWTSGHEDVATVAIVEDKVIITAVKQGVTIITATTVNGLKAICTVTVVPEIISVEKIEVIPTSLEMKEGEIKPLKAVITPEDATDPTVTWKSSDFAVAVVSAEGEVTAMSPGSAIIYASSSNGLTAECYVTVIPSIISATSIIVDPEELSLMEGETAILTATIMPTDVTDRTIIWSSANDDIASVENGVVTAHQAGYTTITAMSSNGLTAQCMVKVMARPLTPRQLLRKGDGTTCTFVTMMDLPDQELTKQGYNYVTGYTDSQGKSQIIAVTPLRYCHTVPEVYNDATLDFWVFSFFENEDGEVLTSNLRHLDGREEICFDTSIYGFDVNRAKPDFNSDNEDWINITPSKIFVAAHVRESMHVAVYAMNGTNVYSKYNYGNSLLTDEIELDRFPPDFYLIVVTCDGKTQSKRFTVR